MRLISNITPMPSLSAAAMVSQDSTAAAGVPGELRREPKPAGRRDWWLANPGVRNFSHMIVGNGTMLLLQGLLFVTLARILGPAEFGRLAATSAVTAVLLPFVGAGSANMMVMRASRDPSVLGTYFGNALCVAGITSLLLGLLAVTAAAPFLGAASSVKLMSVLCLSELLFAKLIDTCGHVFIATERLRFTGRLMVAQSGLRLLALPLFLAISPATALHWACWASATNLIVSAYALYTTVHAVGTLSINVPLALRELPQGLYFSIGLAAKGFYTDADKAFLARFASLEIVGMYTCAFRFVQMALTPVRALAYSSQATFFRAGERGLGHALQLAGRLARPLALYSLLMAFGFLLCAPAVPLLLGASYEASARAMRWLSLLPLLFGAQSLLSDALAGAGRQAIRATLQVLAALSACVLNGVLIPACGWKGAVIASYGSQLLLLAGLLASTRLLRFRPGSS